MPTIVMDLDGTLTVEQRGVPYADLLPNVAVVDTLRRYHAINAVTLPEIIAWLQSHDIPFDEVHVGKPWPEAGGFYVDDRAIRPDEFVSLSHAEIMAITGCAPQ
jgi:hypothetical protein